MTQLNHQKMSRAKLEQFAIERYGSLQAASLVAQRECKTNESIIKNKAPWIRCLEKPMNIEDLGSIATHENWAKGIRENFTSDADA